MKHRAKAFLIVARLSIVMFGWLMCVPANALANPVEYMAEYATEQGTMGPIVRFTSVETAFSDAWSPPVHGWLKSDAEPVWRNGELPRGKSGRTVWVRVRFHRDIVGAEPLAIYTQDNRNLIMINLNGREMFRNFSNPDDLVQAWYRPYLIPVPIGSMRPGVNEITVRIKSAFDLSAGQIKLGPHADLARIYEHQVFWRIDAVKISTYLMLALSIAAFLLWLGRMGELELMFLALSGGLWFVRNYHYFADDLNGFNVSRFSDLTIYSLYFAASASNSFTALFLNIPRARIIVMTLFGSGFLICSLHQAGLIDVAAVFLATLAASALFSAYALVATKRARRPEHWLLTLITVVLTLTGLHDIGRFPRIELWEGLGFYVQPYIGLIFCVTFLFFFGLRALRAFVALEHVNQTLERRVKEASDELLRSEEHRRSLEVSRALDQERTRLMREMHDGIGSNLATALAIAEQQKHSPDTIRTLKRAISDLKITVDSLEPVEGDVPALLGNLRHRMSRDLEEAGFSSRWNVEQCPPLPWLDATNALHLLRIFQEAIGNALTHSCATQLEFGCHPAAENGREGLLVYVRDNGVGTASRDAVGKGISNMRARTTALHGTFVWQSSPGEGTRVSVWLPLVRHAA